MRIKTELTEFEDIYDAVQTGEIIAKMGDVINGEYLMVNGYHLEPMAKGPFYLFTETMKNHSTGLTFTEKYISPLHCPLGASFAHIETLNVEKEEIEI